MPARHKSAPGPRGESCLTCRQRKKKCDKGRPSCQRCLNSKGRLVCLGYDDDSEPEVQRPPRQEPMKARLTKILPSPLVGVEFGDAVPGLGTRTAYFGVPISASDINDYLAPSVDLFMVPSPSETLLITSAHQQDQEEEWDQAVPGFKSNGVTLLLSISIPRGVDANKHMRQTYLYFILEEYQSHRVDKFFRPPPVSMRDLMTTQMKQSRIMENMYLGAKILEAFNGKPEGTAIKLCSRWVTWYANHIMNQDRPNPYPSMQDIECKLIGLLELAMAQFIVLGTAVGYASLRLALPGFLRLISDEPDLWAEQAQSGLCVSLPAVQTSNLVQCRRFVYHDIMYSLILGLPTLAEYSSTGFPVVPGADIPVQWANGVHGVPLEMLVNITEVHNWRARAKNVDWCVLEARTLAWKWRPGEIQSEESAVMIYRTAIQESWRHTTLIYIYMGICGVTSHDPRVQVSVNQIVKLMRIVGDADLDVHFSIPCVIAGLAARHDYQRVQILQKLKTFNGVRLWIIRGRDFARVLEHLWNGPAANGAPIGWDEYVQARRQMLPI